jgi:serine/threonine protein kinase
MLRELDVWLRLKHSTIVPLLGTAQVESPLLALVSQWMSSGTLAEYLDEQAMVITPSTRIGLASRLFTHIQQAFIDSPANRPRALLMASIIVGPFLS